MPLKNQAVKVGITGGIGAGKSIVSSVFNLLGIPVYNADDRAKHLMSHDEALKQEIIREFGEQAYDNGKLNRSYLASNVFNDKQKLQTINKLVHPRVGKDYEAWLNDYRSSHYTIKEAALLFESGSYKQLDKVILVTAPETLRIERVLLRDLHRSKEDVQKIISQQMPDDEKRGLADFVIRNDGKTLVIPQVLRIHDQLKG